MGTKEQERKSISQARFVCQGEYWTLAFDDRLIRLRDSKGLRQLALLLREPGRLFQVLDLVARIDPRENRYERISNRPWGVSQADGSLRPG